MEVCNYHQAQASSLLTNMPPPQYLASWLASKWPTSGSQICILVTILTELPGSYTYDSQGIEINDSKTDNQFLGTNRKIYINTQMTPFWKTPIWKIAKEAGENG